MCVPDCGSPQFAQADAPRRRGELCESNATVACVLRYVVRDETTGEQVAHLRHEGRRLVLELDGRLAEWKRLRRKEGFGFVDPDGRPFLRAKIRGGLCARRARCRSTPV
jgi:hypothetical protein